MAMSKDMTTKQKFEYIKDYYKWHIIIALLIVIAIVCTVVHFATKEEYDIRLFYAGEAYIGSDYAEGINSLTDFCDDITGDGEVKLLFDQFCYGGLNDPQYLTTMTATLEKMIAKEDDVCLVLADEGLAKTVLAMSGKYVMQADLWATDSEGDYLVVSGFPGAVSLKNSAYLKENGFYVDNLYIMLLDKEYKDASAFENAKKVALSLIREETEKEDVNEISEAILSHNARNYLVGECNAEGHIILADKRENENRVVSLLASYGEYGFLNGKFVKVSGSGAIPTRITFDEIGNVKEYLEAEDGAGYTESVKKMFDEETYAVYEGKVKGGNSYTLCKEGEMLYVRRYLTEIGREAEVGEYGDFSYELLTDLGVSVEVSNKMLERKDEFSNYFPYFVGTAEHIIDGVRYVFEVSYDEGKSEISYIQYEYGKDEAVRGMIYDSVTGELKTEI